MRWDYFSLFGYVSVGLWLLVPALWAIHAKRRPRRWLCHIALGLSLLAFILAKINSLGYVNRIQPDQSAEIAAAQAKLESVRKAAVQARSGGVAQVRFAEDTSSDSMDAGGMDSGELKYIQKVSAEAAPDWKKEKKSRSADGAGDSSIESLIGGKTTARVSSPDAGDDVKERPPVLMGEKDFAWANRLDAWNLSIIRLMILLGVGIVIADYLRRANIYGEAYLPLPLPGSWLNALTPVPPVMVRPAPPRRSMLEELAWVIRRGDSFLYLTDDPARAEQVPPSLPSLGKRCCPVDVIRVKPDAGDISDEFIFEALWYGRCSFVVDSPERAAQVLGQFREFLARRKARQAVVAKTVHVIWDCRGSLEADWQQEFAKLAAATGMTLFVCGHQSASPAGT